MNTELLLMIGGLSLLDTLSPATIGITVYLLLTEKKKVGLKLMVYLFTVIGFYFSAGVAIKLGFGFFFEVFSTFLQNRVVSWMLFIVGGILFIWSFYVPKRKKSSYTSPITKTNSTMIALGVTTSLVEVGTALPYFTAIALMTNSGLVWYEWLPLLFAYNVVMVLPPFILYMLYMLLGSVMQKPLKFIQNQVSKSSSSLASWIMCIVGLLLMLYSVDYL
ncbi:GAP family protein [Paenibacillus gallinarum]|uniref:GAP family protein n=1 Tax=Paenibacillus gallinarum TaxID=2762232 RepID=A0ABR8T123_9BACL|nr:GAP family protein [Paenibacillus gallinarum]MBD7969441.1 GAP family protein [Paenibacillus gallinarum]